MEIVASKVTTVRIKLDLSVIDALEPFAEHAVETGLLSSEEASFLIIEEVINSIEVIE